jgi:hypothetical protein
MNRHSVLAGGREPVKGYHVSMKSVGRRKIEHPDRWAEIDRLLETAWALRPTRALVPRGVYRFSSFEEADAWMIRTMARTLALHAKKTSSVSVER